MARRAKCAALCSFGTASAIVSSGQTRSMTCSRCSRRPGASASTFTTAAAWRRFQLASATGAPPTVTAYRPSSVTWMSDIVMPAAAIPSGPLTRREQQVLPLHHGALLTSGLTSGGVPGPAIVAPGQVCELGVQRGGPLRIVRDGPVDRDRRAVVGLEVVAEVLGAAEPGDPEGPAAGRDAGRPHGAVPRFQRPGDLGGIRGFGSQLGSPPVFVGGTDARKCGTRW